MTWPLADYFMAATFLKFEFGRLFSCLVTPLWFALSGKILNLRFTTSPGNDVSAMLLEKCMSEAKNLFHS